MALNVTFNTSFDNMQNWEGIQGKAGEIKCTEAYKTNDEASR
jgi:hypothetical protein